METKLPDEHAVVLEGIFRWLCPCWRVAEQRNRGLLGSCGTFQVCVSLGKFGSRIIPFALGYFEVFTCGASEDDVSWLPCRTPSQVLAFSLCELCELYLAVMHIIIFAKIEISKRGRCCKASLTTVKILVFGTIDRLAESIVCGSVNMAIFGDVGWTMNRMHDTRRNLHLPTSKISEKSRDYPRKGSKNELPGVWNDPLIAKEAIVKTLRSIHGFGTYATENMLQLLGFFDVCAFDSETIR